jgi:hypothetical protein
MKSKSISFLALSLRRYSISNANLLSAIKGTVAPDYIGLKVLWLDRLVWFDRG